MTEQQLEEAIRDLCDKSGLTTVECASVLGTLSANYDDLAADEALSDD